MYVEQPGFLKQENAQLPAFWFGIRIEKMYGVVVGGYGISDEIYGWGVDLTQPQTLTLTLT